MRKNWLLIGVALLAAVLAVAAIACDDDDDEDGDGNGDAVPPATEEAEATDNGIEDRVADGGRMVVALSGLEGSTVTGSATLSKTDTGTGVVVTVAGLEEGTHVNHIHEGACDPLGDIGEPLENLEAGPDGSAPATTTMTSAEFQHLLDEDHVVAVHALDPATIVACAPIGGS